MQEKTQRYRTLAKLIHVNMQNQRINSNFKRLIKNEKYSTIKLHIHYYLYSLNIVTHYSLKNIFVHVAIRAKIRLECLMDNVELVNQ